MKRRVSGVITACFAMMLCAVAQQVSVNTVASSAGAPVPRLIRYSGIAKDGNDKALSGTVGVTFLLYKDEQGGAPLWLETQNVQTDASGHYSVQLGATLASGLPADLFTSGEARWLGVQISGQTEQPRVLLVSVPYALKAGDAETVGGLPASAFVLAAPAIGSTSASAAATATGQSASPPAGAVTGTGTVGYLPLWDTTSDIVSSVVFQSGTGTTAKIGIGIATPASTLDVKGSETVRGALTLYNSGTATAAGGKNSQPLDLKASAFNKGTAAAVNQMFQWQAEPAGNDTTTPSATLNLLFGSGTAVAAETGLHIGSNGQIAFATGQTFPGTGTLTGITTMEDKGEEIPGNGTGQGGQKGNRKGPHRKKKRKKKKQKKKKKRKKKNKKKGNKNE